MQQVTSVQIPNETFSFSRKPSFKNEKIDYAHLAISELHGDVNSILTRARTFKCLWGPRTDSKEWIPPAYVVWRAGT